MREWRERERERLERVSQTSLTFAVTYPSTDSIMSHPSSLPFMWWGQKTSPHVGNEVVVHMIPPLPFALSNSNNIIIIMDYLSSNLQSVELNNMSEYNVHVIERELMQHRVMCMCLFPVLKQGCIVQLV